MAVGGAEGGKPCIACMPLSAGHERVMRAVVRWRCWVRTDVTPHCAGCHVAAGRRHAICGLWQMQCASSSTWVPAAGWLHRQLATGQVPWCSCVLQPACKSVGRMGTWCDQAKGMMCWSMCSMQPVAQSMLPMSHSVESSVLAPSQMSRQGKARAQAAVLAQACCQDILDVANHVLLHVSSANTEGLTPSSLATA